MSKYKSMVPDDDGDEKVPAPAGLELLNARANQDVEGKKILQGREGEDMSDLLRGLHASCAVQHCGFHIERCSEQSEACKKRVQCAITDINKRDNDDIHSCYQSVKW